MSDKSREDPPSKRQGGETRPRPEGNPSGGNQPATTTGKTPVAQSAQGEVADFLNRLNEIRPATGVGRGRLVFAMDATMSRQPTWDMALALQGEMFEAVREIGGLDVQLVYFRGLDECRASRWVSDPAGLARLMTSVDCRGGYTQMRKVLSHTRAECERQRVSALVYVGDCMEEEVDDLCGRAGELALLGVPVFLFQEGADRKAEQAFREIARLTHGAWCRFDVGAGDQLRALLKAVAVFATGGRAALERLAGTSRDRAAARLLQDMTRG